VNQYLNIAALCPSTKALGPGKRFVIWVQGCCFQCANCGSPEWSKRKRAILITPHDLAKEILNVPGLEGITISGGEPMLQATNLLKLVKIIRSERNLSAICYTGFTLKELKEKKDPEIDALLSEVDVLIDGLYIDSLNDNKGWRGSSNQEVHFLSGFYENQRAEFLTRRRDMEIHLFKSHYLMVGIHPKGMAARSLL
jgi:anaerobic ribonucleoside-triphosphate reductase activating protein